MEMKQELQQLREELEAKLSRREDAHSKRFNGTVNESAYQDSCKELKDIYMELADVCDQLGSPIPIRW